MTTQMDLGLHGDAYARNGLLDFAVNIRRGRPLALQATLAAALEDENYPDDGEARSAIASRHGVAIDRVLTLNGACEGFWLLAHALRPRRAACIHPTFTEGELALRATGAAVERAVLRPAYMATRSKWGRRQRQPLSVNALACAALCFATRARDTVERLVTAVDHDRADLTRRLGAIAGLKVYPSATNFLLVEAPGRGDIAEELRARGIAVRPAANFPGLGDSLFRVAVRGAADNGRLARALATVMADA